MHRGGWVACPNDRGFGRPAALAAAFSYIAPTRAAHNERSDATLGLSKVAQAAHARRRRYGYFFLRRNLPTNRLAESFGFKNAK